jgi:hypothetical protein
MPKADSLNGWLKLMQQIRGLVYALQVELTTEVEGGFQPMVKATGNLPAGMKLLVRV